MNVIHNFFYLNVRDHFLLQSAGLVGGEQSPDDDRSGKDDLPLNLRKIGLGALGKAISAGDVPGIVMSAFFVKRYRKRPGAMKKVC